jgi:ribose 5-phosphate isomerase B
MRIALGADHAGVTLKRRVLQALDERHLSCEDFGTDTDTSVDYADYARRVAEAVATGACERGILICGSGIGMAIAANKVRGIRAAPVTDVATARLSREHNDANILTLGARLLAPEDALEIVDVFLATPFGGGRHQTRIDKIAELETTRDPAPKP